jgi:two-component system, chemotaxis family, protein-glutamate methylesterase/glutaminase
MTPEIVLVGVSAGGLDAVSTILRGLPATFGLALVVVQHRSKESTLLCELLQDVSPLPVAEAIDKEPIEAGRVYLAPADYHLLVEAGYLSLSLEEPASYSRPSIDLAFESAAYSYAERTVGVVLTGANGDGANGLRRIVDRGGIAIVQDPATAQVAVMPTIALQVVPEAEVVPLARIAERLSALPGAIRALPEMSA